MSSVQRIICSSCKGVIYSTVYEWIMITNVTNKATARLPTCCKQCADDVWNKVSDRSVAQSIIAEKQDRNDDPFA